MQRDTAARS